MAKIYKNLDTKARTVCFAYPIRSIGLKCAEKKSLLASFSSEKEGLA
jgi:hypothetical protein